ncbi:FMO2 [Branchiostoma lanceolatum]|uniref:Flavin-containing monooxygenase n=1 Tax=Branchiostoma lanceolatum TaxID=7740 RepID=A0A8K0EP62_BRALA|nr:FMO2 [Branchiostoma lanceolatum]
MVLRVAVIGAGPAGLCAARFLSAEPDCYLPTVYEQTAAVGGTWVYTDRTGTDHCGIPVHSSMYKNLRDPTTASLVCEKHGLPFRTSQASSEHLTGTCRRPLSNGTDSPLEHPGTPAGQTNLPKEAMVFPDFPYDSSLPSYLPHKEVLRYLESYAEHFGLHKYIQFLTRVDTVKHVHVHGAVKWQVTSFKVTAPDSPSTEQFDAVMVCNGGYVVGHTCADARTTPDFMRYSVPYTPDIPGTDQFQGRTLHSHDYRVPEPFSGRRVLIIGALGSGIDICVEIAWVADRVVISHSNPPMMKILKLPPNVTQASRVESIVSPNTVRFQDGQEFHADDIVYCTGYRLSLPFLTPECGITLHQGRAYPLYKHVLNTNYPTMSFVGLPRNVTTFSLFQLQVKLALGVLDGSISLPSKAAMDQEIDKDFKTRLEKGLAPRRAHDIFPLYLSYITELAMVTCQPDPQGQTSMATDSVLHLFSDPQHFRNAEYKITGPGTWERIPHESENQQ